MPSCERRGRHAQTAPAPKINEGDQWVYQHTVEDRTGWHQTQMESSVVRASTNSIALDVKPAGSTMPASEQLTGPDWSRFRAVNGHEVTVNRPFVFPLTAGKTWDVEYTEDNPNRQHTSEHWHTTYKVVGWTDVTVPAGTFHALKIETDGEWSAAVAPALTAGSGARVDAFGATSLVQTNRIKASVITSRLFKEFYYVQTSSVG